MDIDRQKARTFPCIAAGVAGLLISRHYSGPGSAILHSHGANVAFSFGAYFILKLWKLPLGERRPAIAGYAFAGVSAQEAAQGLSLYPGVFDPLDLLANAADVAFAWAVDVWTSPSPPASSDGDH